MALVKSAIFFSAPPLLLCSKWMAFSSASEMKRFSILTYCTSTIIQRGSAFVDLLKHIQKDNFPPPQGLLIKGCWSIFKFISETHDEILGSAIIKREQVWSISKFSFLCRKNIILSPAVFDFFYNKCEKYSFKNGIFTPKSLEFLKN